jgi:hypothetical protein
MLLKDAAKTSPRLETAAHSLHSEWCGHEAGLLLIVLRELVRALGTEPAVRFGTAALRNVP